MLSDGRDATPAEFFRFIAFLLGSR